MVIAQAQKIDVEGDAIVFTFAPVHKTLKGAARGASGVDRAAGAGRRADARCPSSPSKARAGAAPPAESGRSGRCAPAPSSRARAKAEPAVQAVLDVFGGEIEDVEEIKSVI